MENLPLNIGDLKDEGKKMAPRESAQHEELVQQTIDRFWEVFPPTWSRVRGNVRSIAAEDFCISVEQFQILRQIHLGNSSVSKLAEVRGISRSAASQVVDGLVGKDLVTRQQNSADRRNYRLELTERGNDLLNSVFQKNRTWMNDQMASLEPGDAAKIIQGLEILKNIFL